MQCNGYIVCSYRYMMRVVEKKEFPRHFLRKQNEIKIDNMI